MNQDSLEISLTIWPICEEDFDSSLRSLRLRAHMATKEVETTLTGEGAALENPSLLNTKPFSLVPEAETSP